MPKRHLGSFCIFRLNRFSKSQRNRTANCGKSAPISTLGVSPPNAQRRNADRLLFKLGIQVATEPTERSNDYRPLLGRVPHDRIPELLAESHVLAQPSVLEPLGQSLLEAMAAGRPVVGTRVGASFIRLRSSRASHRR